MQKQFSIYLPPLQRFCFHMFNGFIQIIFHFIIIGIKFTIGSKYFIKEIICIINKIFIIITNYTICFKIIVIKCIYENIFSLIDEFIFSFFFSVKIKLYS